MCGSLLGFRRNVNDYRVERRSAKVNTPASLLRLKHSLLEIALIKLIGQFRIESLENLVLFQRALLVAERYICQRQIMVGFDVARIQLYGVFERGCSVLVAFGSEVNLTEIVVRFGASRFQHQRLLVSLNRLVKLARLKQS